MERPSWPGDGRHPNHGRESQHHVQKQLASPILQYIAFLRPYPYPLGSLSPGSSTCHSPRLADSGWRPDRLSCRLYPRIALSLKIARRKHHPVSVSWCPRDRTAPCNLDQREASCHWLMEIGVKEKLVGHCHWVSRKMNHLIVILNSYESAYVYCSALGDRCQYVMPTSCILQALYNVAYSKLDCIIVES